MNTLDMNSEHTNVQNQLCNVLVCGQTCQTKIKFALELWDGRLDVRYRNSEEDIVDLLNAQPAHILLIDFDDVSIDPIKILVFINGEQKSIISIGVTESPPLDQIVDAAKLGVRTVVDVKSNVYQLQKEIRRAYEQWQNHIRGQNLFDFEKSDRNYNFVY